MRSWWRYVAALVVLGGGFVLGWMARGGLAEPAAGASEAAESAVWTCPMHPQVRMPDDVPCPICGMDLVKLEEGSSGGRPELTMTPAAVALAGLRTAPVGRRLVSRRIRMAGTVAYDETRIRTISSRVSGWIERMFVDYTGMRVRAGDHLVRLYSPDLLTAQQELLAARRQVGSVDPEGSAFSLGSDQRVMEAARHKLRLLGLTAAQVLEMETRGSAEDHVLIESAGGGVVIERAVEEGDHVRAGAQICRIAELDRLWLLLHAYEQDLPWIRYGQEVVVEADARPGEVFRGWISFVDPAVDPRTRTVDLRVTLENPGERLKPGMFARAHLTARLGAFGRVIDPRLADKWISPMHPEIVRDAPGQCDVCGMDLVPAERLGYAMQPDAVEVPLVVPASAVLRTGRRAIVYVADSGAAEPTYEGREVVLGPRAGDVYIVLAGLQDDEHVVVEGAFKLDSELQLRAKPSMMSMAGEEDWLGSKAVAFRLSLVPVFEDYLAVQTALAADDSRAAGTALRALRSAVHRVDAAALRQNAAEHWAARRVEIEQALAMLRPDADLEAMRTALRPLSDAVIAVEESFGHTGAPVYAKAFCPMAAGGHGAHWLQLDGAIANPYFGASMLRCGEIEERHVGVRVGPPERDPGSSGRVTSAPTSPPAAGQTTSQPSDAAPEAAPEVDPEDGAVGGGAETEGAPTEEAGAPAEEVAAGPALAPVFEAYFDAQAALAADQLDGSKAALARLVAALPAAEGSPGLSESWRTAATELRAAGTSAAQAADLDATRLAFRRASEALIALVHEPGDVGAAPHFEVHCPMAFDGAGASWLQRDEQVSNPFYGASMLRCGNVTHRHEGAQHK
ncbi:MAG: efflux RND transporter periplasmic adaptor subunit [Planctomycetota bacterium]